MEKYQEKLKTKINRILSDIEESIQSDNQELNTEELPKAIDSEKLREKLSEINKRLKEPTKKQAKELLNSEKGLEHRSKRPIEVEGSWVIYLGFNKL